MNKLTPMTVDEVVALAKRKGEIIVNPLKYRRDRVTNACFTAAKLGLLKKIRVSCGKYIFTPV